VAALSAVALLGVAFRLPIQAPQTAASLSQRLRLVLSPGVRRALLVTLLWSMGGFVVYTYSALLFRTVAGLNGPQAAIGYLAFGIGAVVGTFAGGQIVDRFGTGRLLITSLFSLVALAMSLPVIAASLVPPTATAAVLAVFGIWGVVGWAFLPAQQSRLIAVGPTVAPIVLSLNQSALYLGVAAGAAAGAFALKWGDAPNVGWIGALCELAAVTVLLSGRRSALPTTAPQPEPARAG
jgi:predicted MFS family arabinose efflux permease